VQDHALLFSKIADVHNVRSWKACGNFSDFHCVTPET